MRIVLPIGLFLFSVCILQYVGIRLAGGVGGTFGIMPRTHMCIGFVVKADDVLWLPDGSFGLDTILDLRYEVSSEHLDEHYCLGQDVWFGE